MDETTTGTDMAEEVMPVEGTDMPAEETTDEAAA